MVLSLYFHSFIALAQVYDGLRKIAGYNSLSDKGGNTDLVTRKVWATLLAMIHPLRPMNKEVTEGLMLTDGDAPNRAVVEEVPFTRQAAARADIATTMSGNLPTTRHQRRRRKCGTPAGEKSTSPAGPFPRARRCGSKRTREPAGRDELQWRRHKARRTRPPGTAAATSPTLSQETGSEDHSDVRRGGGEQRRMRRLEDNPAAASSVAAASAAAAVSAAAAAAAATEHELDAELEEEELGEELRGNPAAAAAAAAEQNPDNRNVNALLADLLDGAGNE